MSSVDVIIPCYRYAHFLREAVTSVLTQTGPSVRVLILDDASPDDTPEVADHLVRSDSRVNYVRHALNKGHIATYNEGIDWVSATYYLLLSADDYLLPGALKRAVDFMDTQPEVMSEQLVEPPVCPVYKRGFDARATAAIGLEEVREAVMGQCLVKC